MFGLGTEMFSRKPSRAELGETFYTPEELGNLVGRKFPVRLTNRTID